MIEKKGLPTRMDLILLWLVVFIITMMGVKGSFYIYLFITGSVLSYYILKYTKHHRLPIIFLTSIFWSSSLLIAVSGVFAIVAIPIRIWVLWIPGLILIPLLLFKPIKFSRELFTIEKHDYVLFLFVIFALSSHVFSIINFSTPILHDPISHATWAANIYDTGLINTFYSPGLHILSALGMMVDNVSVAKYILIITNLFSGLSFLPAYLFLHTHFKNRWCAIVGSSLFLIGLFPSKFFWATGKNALAVAIPFMFLLLFVTRINSNRIRKLLVINVLVFTLILIHYPMAAIGIIGVFFIIILFDGYKGLVSIVFGVGIGLLYGVSKVRYQIEYIEGNVAFASTQRIINLTNVLDFFKNQYRSVLPQFNFPFGNLLFYVGILGFFIMVFAAMKHKRHLSFIGFLIGNVLLVIFIRFIRVFRPLSLVASTFWLVFFIFVYVCAAYVFSESILPYIFTLDKKYEYLLVTLVIFWVGISSLNIYTQYKSNQEKLNIVFQADLEAFEWIDENISKDLIMLNNAAENNRKVFASDAGAWLPVYTGNQIAMPFTEFSSKKTFSNYDVFLRILNDEYTCGDIDYLLENGIRYYYRGSKGMYGPQILLSEEENFNLIHSVGSAEVYEILPCEK